MPCYRQHNDINPASATWAFCPHSRSDNSFSCNQTFCEVGDLCGRYGFCYSQTRATTRSTSYYLGGCDDPDLADSEVCPDRHCSLYKDVIYDEDRSLWSCCEQETTNGTVVRNCNATQTEDFGMFPPTLLFAKSRSTMQSTAVPSAYPSESLLASSLQSSRWTDSIKKYVGGIIPAAVLIGLLVGFLICRRRRTARRKLDAHELYGPQANDMEAALNIGPELDSRWALCEMSTARKGAELDSKPVVSELPVRQEMELKTMPRTVGT